MIHIDVNEMKYERNGRVTDRRDRRRATWIILTIKFMLGSDWLGSRTDLIWHPCSLYFEVAASDTADERCEIGLGIDHFDDISYMGKKKQIVKREW